MGLAEVVVIAIVILLVFGPERLPELLRQGGKLWRAWQGILDDVGKQINKEMYLDDVKKRKDNKLKKFDELAAKANEGKDESKPLS